MTRPSRSAASRLVRSRSALSLLIGRGLRSRPARRASVLLIVAFALLSCLFVSVSAFTLIPAQKIDSSFGSATHRAYQSGVLGDLPPGSLASLEKALIKQVPSAHVLIRSSTFRPDSYTKYFFKAPTEVVSYVEGASLREVFPGRYSLLDGVWPSAPRDVMVSQHLLDLLSQKTKFTVLSGTAELRVVGVVKDKYSVDGDIIIAAPGTWESLKPLRDDRQYQATDRQLTVMWSGATTPAQLGQILSETLPADPLQRDGVAGSIENNSSTSAETLAQPVPTFGSDQIVVSYGPLLLIALLVTALVIASVREPHSVSSRRLTAVGIPRTVVVQSQVATMAITGVCAITVGLALGWLIAIVVRLTILPLLAGQVLSPLPALPFAIVAIALCSLITMVVGAAWPIRTTSSTRPTLGRRVFAHLQATLIRRVLIVLLFITAFAAAAGPSFIIAPYLAIAAVILLTPDLLHLALWVAPGQTPRFLVARTLSRSTATRQGIAVMVIAGCIAVPMSVGTQLVTKKLSDSSFTFSLVPKNQIWIEKTGDSGDVLGAARAVATVPGISRAIPVRSLAGPADADGAAGAVARFAQSATGNMAIMVLDSEIDAKNIFGTIVTAKAETTLADGGVLNFLNTTGSQKIAVYESGGIRSTVTPEIETLKIDVSKGYKEQFAGVILTKTARELLLPVSEPVTYIHTGVDESEITQAVAATIDSGYDSEFVHYFVPPPVLPLPTAAYMFFSGLILGGFFVLFLVVDDQARRLRSYSSRLVAIGLRPSWTLSILGLQSGLVVLLGMIIGFGSGLIGLAVISNHYVVTVVPTTAIAAASIGVLLAAAIATIMASRRLTAGDYGEVT